MARRRGGSRGRRPGIRAKARAATRSTAVVVPAAELPAREASSPGERLVAVAIGALGLLAFFHPMVLSGFARLPGDLGDARLVHYFLEHSWLWLLQRPAHAAYWDAPFFHPARNVMAYSETLLGSAPVYWAARLLPFEPARAFQLWLLTWTALNFVGTLLVFRRIAGVPLVPAAVGAFLFAYGGARATHLTHAQLLPQLFSLVVVAALAVLLVRRRPQPVAAIVGGLAAAAQLWASFYLGFFLFLATAVVIACALALGATRPAVVQAARRNTPWLLVAAAVAGGVLAPLVWHYGQAATSLPDRPFHETVGMIPTVDSWLRMGPWSWAYRWLESPAVSQRLGSPSGVPIGAGWVTSVCAVLGLWGARGRPWLRVVLIATAVLLLMTLRLGPLTPWSAVAAVLPGASAARAVFRVAHVLLLPLGLGVALFLQSRKRSWVAWVLGAAVCVEQLTTLPSFEIAEATARARWVATRVPAECESFLFVPGKEPGAPHYPSLFYHVDAMAAQLERGVPTLNGYSGNSPVGYPLYDIVAAFPAHRDDARNRLARWAALAGLAAEEVCVVEEDVPFL